MAGTDWYSGLAEDQQTLIQEAISEANDYIFEVQRTYNKERLEKIKEAKPGINIIELTEEERQAFQEKAKAVRDKYVEMTGEEGKQTLESLTKEIEEAEKEMGSS